MSPDSLPQGPLRSAEELNAAIRALFTHRDARLSDEQRAEYRALLDELRQAEAQRQQGGTPPPLLCHRHGMDNVQRIYRRSEKRHIPSRPCPDCGVQIRGRWKEHGGLVADLDPQGSVTWRCQGRDCLTGKEGF